MCNMYHFNFLQELNEIGTIIISINRLWKEARGGQVTCPTSQVSAGAMI